MTVPVTVQVADRDVTTAHDGLLCSNTDPGGFEICQLNPTLIQGLRPGAPIIVRYGMEYVWHGRLNEPGQHMQGQRDTFELAGVGYAAALKDNPYAEIYVSRDLAHWQGAGTQRRLNQVTANLSPGDPSVVPDSTTGAPSIAEEVNGVWTTTTLPVIEAYFDAGSPIRLGSLYYAVKKNGTFNTADANWTVEALLSSDDILTATDSGGNVRASLPATGTVLAATATRRFAVARVLYNAAVAGGTENATNGIYWTVLAAYGTHALPKRGSNSATSAQGFYPSDIARDAFRRAKAGIAAGVIEDSTGLILPHSVYLTPTGPDQIVDDMAKLLGWHWGVWEPATVFDTQPTAHFRAPPADATAVVGRSECIELDPPKVRYDLLYDTAKVTWRDQAGSTGVTTVTVPNPLLGETGASGRTLMLDMGLGDATSAQVFGQFALLLSQRTARGGGYAILPDTVALPGGGRKPACLLKSGRDRLRITDLPDSGPLHEADSRRYDTFHVRRVEMTIVNGVPQTRVDFDGGADLMEVLQAREAAFAPLLG
jgi:hypothetical protein